MSCQALKSASLFKFLDLSACNQGSCPLASKNIWGGHGVKELWSCKRTLRLQTRIQIFDELASQVTARIRWRLQQGGDCHPLWICEGHSDKRGRDGEFYSVRITSPPTPCGSRPVAPPAAQSPGMVGLPMLLVPVSRLNAIGSSRETSKRTNQQIPQKKTTHRDRSNENANRLVEHPKFDFQWKRQTHKPTTPPKERHHLDGSEINV